MTAKAKPAKKVLGKKKLDGTGYNGNGARTGRGKGTCKPKGK